MKTHYITTLLLLFTQLLFAQTTYTHDANGNRIKRMGGAALPVTLISFEATKVLGDRDEANELVGVANFG